jgi:hypothetical protein
MKGAIMTTRSRNDWRSLFALGLLFGFAVLVLGPYAFAAAQKTFSSADAAVTALVDAAKAADRSQLDPLFGPGAEEVLPSGDPVADRAAREQFVTRAGERTHLERVGDDFAVLSVGNDDWPFPIPLVRENGAWRFDTEAGKTEILNRRIGRNELYTIQTMQEYVNAQRDYARRQKAATGVKEYAQRLVSTPGKHDGLYWETKAGEDESPIGPLFASATREGYRPGGASPEPFHGYLYKVLSAAGSNAPGGSHSYLEKGRQTRGFALLAYPVHYGSSGVMTFQVNEQGVVFQKDLGPKTADLASHISVYDPDDSWDATED